MPYIGSRAPALYSGLGSIDPSQWTSSGGVARPKNSQALSVFQDLQVQTNRIAAINGITRVAVDGVIGPATMNAVKAVAGRLFYTPAASFRTVDDVAASADVTAAVFKARADNLGAPISSGTPAPGTPVAPPISLPANFPGSFPQGGGQPVAPPLPPGAPGAPSDLEMMVSGVPGGMSGVIIALGALGIMLMQKKGMFGRTSRGGGKKPRRAAGRRGRSRRRR